MRALQSAANIGVLKEAALTVDAKASGKQSLRRAVMLAIAAGVTLPALTIGPFVVLDSFRSDESRRIHALMQQYGTSLGTTLAQSVWLADPASAEVQLQAVLTNPDVVGVEVDDATLGRFLSMSKAVEADEARVSEKFPIIKDSNTIGTVTVVMTKRHVRAQLTEQIVKTASAIGLQIALTLVILALVFERRLIRPVQALRDALQRMASGELKTPVPAPAHDDELGTLAQGLDHLRSTLATTLEEVRQLNQDLEQRVIERTHELESAMHKLKSAQTEIERAERMAALGAMVAGISHELNTPIGNSLTVASTLVELSEDFQTRVHEGITRSNLNEYVQSTAEAASLLTRSLEKAAQLIGSFKQVAVDRTAAHRREFALDVVLNETLTTLIAVTRRKGHGLESDLEPGIIMDSYPGQLGQALTNIVHNAELHGLEGHADGRIRVQAHRLPGENVEIRISDNGVGIPPEHIRRIFDPFFTTKMGRGGSGLGLNIVHNLVRDVLGGAIEVQSIVGHGTTFILTLPQQAPHPPEPELQEQA